jgi:hypothetical protein
LIERPDDERASPAGGRHSDAAEQLEEERVEISQPEAAADGAAGKSDGRPIGVEIVRNNSGGGSDRIDV